MSQILTLGCFANIVSIFLAHWCASFWGLFNNAVHYLGTVHVMLNDKRISEWWIGRKEAIMGSSGTVKPVKLADLKSWMLFVSCCTWSEIHIHGRTTCCPVNPHPFSTSMDSRWEFCVDTDPLLYLKSLSNEWQGFVHAFQLYHLFVNVELYIYRSSSCTVKFS